MLTKPPYPTFNQFTLALQGHEQSIIAQKEEEKHYLEHAQAFLGQRGRGCNSRGGRGFNSRGRGFSPTTGRGTNTEQNVNSTKPRNTVANGSENTTRNSDGNQSAQSKKPKIMCQICGRNYHSAINCWYRYDYSYQADDSPQALATFSLNEQNDNTVYVDSSATSYMTNDPGILSNTKSYAGSDVIFVGNGDSLPISYVGDVELPTSHGKVPLHDVLVVPALKKNLLSVEKLTSDYPCTFEFISSGFVIKDT